mgnify:CR=1 FL=1
MTQMDLFPMHVRPDFGMPSWPKHPSAGQPARIVGPGTLLEGRHIAGFVDADVEDGYGIRTMHLKDLRDGPAPRRPKNSGPDNRAQRRQASASRTRGRH